MPTKGDDWTRSEEQTLETNWNTHSAQEIADMLPGRTLDAVYAKHSRMKEDSGPQPATHTDSSDNEQARSRTTTFQTDDLTVSVTVKPEDFQGFRLGARATVKVKNGLDYTQKATWRADSLDDHFAPTDKPQIIEDVKYYHDGSQVADASDSWQNKDVFEMSQQEFVDFTLQVMKRHRDWKIAQQEIVAPNVAGEVDIVFSADAEETAALGVQRGGPLGAGPGEAHDWRVVAVSPEMEPHLNGAGDIIKDAYDVDVRMGRVKTVPSSAIREQTGSDRQIVLDRSREDYGRIWE